MAEKKKVNKSKRLHTTPIMFQEDDYKPKIGLFYDDKGNKVETEYFQNTDGTYFTYNDDFKEIPLVMFDRMSPEELEKWRQTASNSPYRKGVNEVQKRQAMMRAAGYDVPDNGLWDDEQQSMWNSLTTKDKDYDTTLKGFAQGMTDKFTGNTTYQGNPLMQAQVKTYDSNNIDWDKTRTQQNQWVKAIDGTWLPVALASMAPALSSSFVASPIAATATLGGGWLGGNLIDKASEAITGRNFSTNVSMFRAHQ